jgi:hypothetical protein
MDTNVWEINLYQKSQTYYLNEPPHLVLMSRIHGVLLQRLKNFMGQCSGENNSILT